MTDRIFPPECDLIIAYLRKHVKRPVKPCRTEEGPRDVYGWERTEFIGSTCCPMGLLPEANDGRFIAGTVNETMITGNPLRKSANSFWPIWDLRCAGWEGNSEAAWREIWPEKEKTV